MKVMLAYVNQIGVSCVVNMSSVMSAVRTMDEFVKAHRVNIVVSESGEPKDVQACVIVKSGNKQLVYAAKPERYTFNTVEVEAISCSAHVYEIMIKTGRRTLDKKTMDSMHAATLYVHGLHAGYPVFMRRDGEIVAVDNCGPKWASYSIHASADQPDQTPAPKAGVVSMPDPEPEYIPETDLDATLDEMNDAIGYDDFVNTVADDSFI